MDQKPIIGQENQHSSPLNFIREGMTVYDREDDKIGSVERLYFGSGSTVDQDEYNMSVEPGRADLPGNALVDAIANVFDPTDIPQEMQERLLQSGFIRIDGAGLFAADRYVMPDQIASVSDEAVYLKVTKDELLKR
jgi:hypothetical protein